MTTDLPSGLERVFFDVASREAIDGWLAELVRERLGTDLSEITFRAGRIDAVYGLLLGDGRPVVVKLHRPPVDVEALRTSVRLQRYLVSKDYPCPEPIDGPVVRDRRVVTIESLMQRGTVADARLPAIRRAMASSLAEHIDILGAVEQAGTRLGKGPAWTRYVDGPWPEPHDTIFDFSVTPDGWTWLDDFARTAATELVEGRDVGRSVTAHGDWYAGNLLFEHDRVVAAFDWDFIVEPPEFVAGMTAGGYLLEGAPSPDQVADFLIDFDDAHPGRFGPDQRRLATAAARWVLAFNARCQLAMLDGEVDSASALGRLLDGRASYEHLVW